MHLNNSPALEPVNSLMEKIPNVKHTQENENKYLVWFSFVKHVSLSNLSVVT